jgi:hypothetical protein
MTSKIKLATVMAIAAATTSFAPPVLAQEDTDHVPSPHAGEGTVWLASSQLFCREL